MPKYFCNECYEEQKENKEYGCYLEIKNEDNTHGKLVSCVLSSQDPPAKWNKIKQSRIKKSKVTKLKGPINLRW